MVYCDFNGINYNILIIEREIDEVIWSYRLNNL